MNSLLSKLSAIKDKFEYLQEQLSDPSISSDMKKFMKVNKEYKGLEPLVKAHEEYKAILDGLAECKEILDHSDEAEFKEMAKMEMDELLERQGPLEEDIKHMLIPKDPEDEKNVTIEIRSGAGGDEAAIFAGDLLRMYERYIDKMGWKRELISETASGSGGYSKVFMEVTGDGVYGLLKYESGTHRVQRVPKTESQGRVHTSTATVAIMPIFETEDIQINTADLSWDTFRASGAGGQHVNKTESAVRVTHKPTGVVVECQEGRSQHRNREIALQKLYARLFELQQQEQQDSITDLRNSLVVSSDRSSKIRTYNYPQNRVTDHRINFTRYNLGDMMNGAIDEFIEAIQTTYNAEKLKASEEV
ncbi:peptide chain release factor 1 [Saprospira grandis DSM 2844]|uniref:Peptide chain release factor 1 n=1 Tax=Saprospira grandis DSM 2844 TaxID=694433 RepID=J1I3Y7_9BACT|nr:peptide chain release factor 1 [Saprospira grandis]EJF53048.1 peptide chain release factor 1 [Saprospira grandis DSM 2844]